MEGSLDNIETSKPVRDELGRLLPGQRSINPAGRPKGLTIKERVRKWLEEHPEDMQAFVNHFVKKNRELTWAMLEGSPKSSSDVKLEIPLPIADVSNHHGISQDQIAQLQDPSGTGGNVGV